MPAWFDRSVQDVRQGLRIFAKTPGFAAIAVLSIALGTGANVAMYSVVDALLLRPAPVVDPDGLLTVGHRIDTGIYTALRMSYADYRDVRDRVRSFGGLLAYTSRWAGFAPDPDTPARLKIATLVSANYFEALGVPLHLGRPFGPEEDRAASGDAVAVITYELWQQVLGGDPGVLGRRVRVSGIDVTIIGVAPKDFAGLDPYVTDSLYLPLALLDRVVNAPGLSPTTDRSLRLLVVKGRLQPEASRTAAAQELVAIGRELATSYPDTNRGKTLSLQTELQMRFERRPLDSHAVVLLVILSIAVLGVACANVAALLVSRAPVRARELAVRLAVGAGRGQVVTQLVTESVVIAAAGALGGVVVGYAGIVLLRRIELPSEVIKYPAFNLDERTLGVSLVAALLSVFVFGVGPAIQTTRVDVANAMKAGEATPTGHRRLRGRAALITLQVAVSLVVLTIATFVIQIYSREFASGPGFRTANLAMARLDAAQARYEGQNLPRFFERAAEEARRIPGVVSAAVTSEMPLAGIDATTMVPDGYRATAERPTVRLYTSVVDEAYFATIDIPIVAGRGFRAADTGATPLVAIVNESLARKYWPSVSAVGRRFRLGGDRGPWIEIVGVARNSTYLYTGEAPFDIAYLPLRQQPVGNMFVIVQTRGDSAALVDPLVDMARRLDPAVPVFDAQTMEHFYDVRSTKLATTLIGLITALGLMGLILTMVGLYGLVSYAVSRRTREIGVRVAVGATPERVLTMVLHDGMRPVWVGVLLGLAMSVATGRLLPALVPVGEVFTTTTVVTILPLIVGVSVLAALLPARTAARVDPTVALRHD